jgi:DNA repair ATPase RecN
VPLQPLDEFEREALLSEHRLRYHAMVQNTAALERWLAEAQHKAEAAERDLKNRERQLADAKARIAALEKLLKDHSIEVPR